jgi:transcriptional/translational regulatory protein YebC/TACO1
MRKLAVFRLGFAQMLSGDATALVPFVLNNDFPLIGTSVGFGFVSFIYSEAGPLEIKQAYQKVEESMDDTLPLIIVDLELEDAVVYLPESDLPNYYKCLREFEEEVAKLEAPAQTRTTFKIQMTLDELLDLANERGGIDKLTPDELTLLQKLSAQ